MAQGRNQLEIDVVANIRAAQKQIEALVSKPYTINFNSKGGGFAAPLGKIKGQLGEFEKSLEASNARVIAFGASASAIYAVEKALSESVKAAIEVEKALKDINVILNLTDKSLAQFGTSLFDIAKNTGNAFSTVASAATELSRQGLGVAETLKRTQDALILTRLSGLGAVDSVEAITAALNGFQKTALSSTVVINKLAAVDASFAVSSADLADAIKRVGSSAEDAGVSFDELLAIVTSAQQITARGGAVIGNSFKTIFTRLQRPKVLEDLQQLGIQTQTAAGNTRPLIQILSDLAKTYDTLSDGQKASIAETVGGVFQINVLKAALGDLNKEYSIFSNALQISTGATDEAIRRNEELNTTLASLLNKTIANLTAAGAKIGELSLAPALKKVFGGLNTILENIGAGDSEDVGSKIGEGLLRGIGNFLSGPGLIIGAKALFTIFERLTVFTADAAKTILNLNTKTAEQAQLQQQIFNVLSKDPAIIAQITSGQSSLKDIQESILNTIKAQTLAMEQQVTLSKTLAASLSAAGVSVSKSGPTSGRLQAKAGGFVPNLFGQEEQNARSMGAVNPKAQISQGTIGGQKFIKNNKEIEIVGMGSNGDSAVIPTYGSVGNQRQKELYDKLKFLGFVPNFAGGQSVGIQAHKEGVKREDLGKYLNNFPLTKEQQNIAIAAFDQKSKTPTGTKTIDASNTAIISATGARKSVGQVEYVRDLNKNPLKTKFVGIHGIVPESLTGDDFTKFDALIEKHLPQAMIGIANELSKGTSPSGGYPNGRQIAESIRSDTSGYPQIAGRIFEVAIQTAINKQLQIAKSQGEKGNQTWDFGPDDFGLQAEVTRAIFGDDQAAILMSSPYIDAKRSPVGTENTNASLKSKFFNTPYFQQKIKSAKAMARGYIPNFAGIRTAMQAEKKMGGNPALDFQEGVGLYVRDKSTQPNFAAVKRDHPEGISQAMKNSQKAQESLARGFIPNFAPTTMGNIGGGLKKAFDDQAIPEGIKKLKDNIFSASFALSSLSGIVETFNKDSKSAFGTVTSEILKGASTFTSIAAVIPGQAGLIVGAVAGLNQAIEGITKSIRDAPINKIIENSKLSAESFSRLNDSTQKYAATFEKLQEIYKSDKSFKDVQKGEKDLYEALLDVPPQYRTQLASAKNLTEIQDVIAKALASEGKNKKQIETAAGIGTKVQGAKQSGGIGGVIDYLGVTGEQIQSGFMGQGFSNTTSTQLSGGVYTSKGKDAERYAKGDAEKITSGLSKDFFDAIANKTIDLNQTGAEFIKTLSKFGLSLEEEEVLTTMLNNERAAGAENFDLLAQQIKILGLEANDAKRKLEEGSKAREEEIAKRKAAEEAARKEERAKQDAAEAAAISAEASRASAVAEFKLASVRESNLSKIANAAASSELQTAQPFTTAKGMAVGQAAIEQSTRINAAQAEKAQLGTGAIDTISANFANSIQKQIDEGIQNKQDVTELQNKKAKIAGIVKEGGGPEVIAQKLEALGKSLNLENIGALQSQTTTALKEMQNNIALVEEELKTSNIIAAKQLQEQIKQIRNQERLKALGGMQGFLNPETLKEPVEKLLGGFQKAQTGKKYGLENTAARGFAEAGMATLELTGGAGSADVNAALKESVVPQQTKFIEQTFKDLAAQSRATKTPEGEKLAKVFDMQAKDAGKIALAQFDAAFQKEQLPQNVAKILAEVTKIASGDIGAPETSVSQGIGEAQAQEPAMTELQKIYVEEFQKSYAKDPTIAETAPTMRSGAAGGYQFGFNPEETQAINSIDTSTAIGEKPKGATLPDGTFIANQPTKPLMNTNTSQVPTSTVNGIANKTAVVPREFTPDINKPLAIGEKGALTPAEANKYLGENMNKQDTLRQKAADVSVKAAEGDKGAQVELQEIKEILSGLVQRYEAAQEEKTLLDSAQSPVDAGVESMAKKLGRSRAEMQSTGVNEEQRMKAAADRALGPERTKGNQTSTSKGEVNVSFTPISIDIKGAVETASDALNEKMTDAIKQAIEQLAPGIISKIYGPPRDKAKT